MCPFPWCEDELQLSCWSISRSLDLSKALDTVNHVLLFNILEHYGVRGLPLEWVKSYFCNRSQFVEFNNYRSAHQKFSCGLAQGSILGPLFFILYVNDIIKASQLETILFADTQPYLSPTVTLFP